MKPRSSSKAIRRKVLASAAAPRPQGRWERVYLSPEYLAWAKRKKLKAGHVAGCIIHTFAEGDPEVFFASDKPNVAERVFDLGKESSE